MTVIYKPQDDPKNDQAHASGSASVDWTQDDKENSRKWASCMGNVSAVPGFMAAGLALTGVGAPVAAGLTVVSLAAGVASALYNLDGYGWQSAQFRDSVLGLGLSAVGMRWNKAVGSFDKIGTGVKKTTEFVNDVASPIWGWLTS
ncbi:hypothetical protein [Streptomyces xanthochromogenes]|uniref:hypothetical protein n=1 Tax=Streptomyces xanthochromogenes TaxID=67384 RepID=UPI002F4208BD